MVVYGYLRVSTSKQYETNYKAAILQLANDKNLGKVIWIQETVSGRKDWRNRLLGKEFEKMKEGDVIIVGEYSRIGRDFLQSMSFLAECRRRKIDIYSTLGDIPMDNDAVSNLMLAVTAWKSQVERETLAYRTKIGIQSAKERGSILGRKKEMVLDKDLNNIKKVSDMVAEGVKFKSICKTLGCTPPTLRKFIKKHDLKHKNT